MLLFDIDGTLIKTGGAGKAAFEYAFKQELSIDDPFSGLHLSGMMDGAIIDEVVEGRLSRKTTSQDHERIHRTYVARMALEMDRYKDRFQTLVGVSKILHALKDAGCHLGLATGNYVEVAQMKLKAAGIWSFFNFGGFGTDAILRPEMTRIAIKRGLQHAKTPIPMDRIWVIGDSPKDVQAARANGARCLAVASGWTSVEDLTLEEPDAVFQDLSDLAALMRTFGIESD